MIIDAVQYNFNLFRLDIHIFVKKKYILLSVFLCQIRMFFLPFDWAVHVILQQPSSLPVTSTRTAHLTAGSNRTPQMTMTGRDTLVQPQQITQAPVETTQTKVRPNWMTGLFKISIFCTT